MRANRWLFTAALVLLMWAISGYAGCSSKAAAPVATAPAPATWLKRIELADGTRCVRWDSGLVCDWKDKQ